MSYNGWSNKPTWQVMLWIDNTEGMREAAQEAIRNSGEDLYSQEQAAREFVEEAMLNNITSKSSLASDMLSYVLSEVNWEEVVRALEEE